MNALYQSSIPLKMIVYFPTITGRKHHSALSREIVNPYLGDTPFQSETIFNSSGKCKSKLIDILKLTRDYPIVLSSGHASKEETYDLLEICAQFNISSLLLNQPANPLAGLNASELKQIAKDYSFAWIEQTSLTYLLSYQDKTDFTSVMCDVPRVIYSSDLGQISQPDIPEWLKISNEWFSELMISDERKEEIYLINPLQLLKI